MTAELKAQLRKHFFRQRKQLGDKERQRQSDAICQVLLDWYRGLRPADRPSGKVAMTIQFGTEPDTDPAMHAFYDEGVEIWVPISHADRSMSWVTWGPDVQMEKSSLGPIRASVGDWCCPVAVTDTD